MPTAYGQPTCNSLLHFSLYQSNMPCLAFSLFSGITFQDFTLPLTLWVSKNNMNEQTTQQQTHREQRTAAGGQGLEGRSEPGEGQRADWRWQNGLYRTAWGAVGDTANIMCGARHVPGRPGAAPCGTCDCLTTTLYTETNAKCWIWTVI